MLSYELEMRFYRAWDRFVVQREGLPNGVLLSCIFLHIILAYLEFLVYRRSRGPPEYMVSDSKPS